jgi:hypothetical protein
MNGKIFAESANIYEDQAKVLFDYFRQTAELIVKQEQEMEQKIAVAKEEQVQFTAAKDQKTLHGKLGFIGAGVSAIAALVLLILKHGDTGPAILPALLALCGAGFGVWCLLEKRKLEQKVDTASSQVSVFEQAHKEIRRDFRVHKLGVGYVPVAGRIPFEGKSFLIDYTGTEEKKDFRLSTVRNKELFASAIHDLDHLIRSVPVVENSTEVEEMDTDQYSRSIQKIPYYDYFGGLDRRLRTITHCLGELETSSVQIPVIFPETAYAHFLAEHATTVPDNATIFPIFDTQRFNDSVEKFQSLNQMKKSLERHSRQFEQVLRTLMVNVAQTVQAITELKVTSTNQMVERSNRLFYTVLKASYNHYSPRLEAEEIERIRNESFDYQDSVDSYKPFQMKSSSRVLFDPISENWVAEDGSKTSYPFGLQQLQEEVLAPIVESLMLETRIERLKIYHNIQDQKNDYLNKWHQDTEDFYGRNRAESADLINLMRSSFTEFIANYNTLQALEQTDRQMVQTGDETSGVVQKTDTAAESMLSYEAQRGQFQAVQDGFVAYMERLKEEIDRRAEKFRYIEYYDASLRDNPARAMSQASNQMGSMDERRKPLLAVNPLYAESSELAPPPSMEQLTDTHYALNLNSLATEAIRQLEDQGGR